MRRELVTAAIAILLITAVFGIGYPLLVTGVSQVAFPNKSDGSQIKLDGKVIGSRLIAQPFSGRRWFRPRPSPTTGYDPSATSFSNLGPNSKDARRRFAANVGAYLALEKPYDATLTRAGVPVDAATSSASGVDPHISVANARIQARRIAAVRRLSLERVNKLIDDNTDGRGLGLFGEPGVNVLTLNLALAKEAPLR